MNISESRVRHRRMHQLFEYAWRLYLYILELDSLVHLFGGGGSHEDFSYQVVFDVAIDLGCFV